MFEDKDREKTGRGIGCRGRYCHFWASDEGGGVDAARRGNCQAKGEHCRGVAICGGGAD